MGEAERQSRRTSHRSLRTPAIVDAHNDLLVEVAHFAARRIRSATAGSTSCAGAAWRLQVCPVSVDVNELPECGPAAQPDADRRVPSGGGRRPGRRARSCATRDDLGDGARRRAHRPAAVDGGRRAARLRPDPASTCSGCSGCACSRSPGTAGTPSPTVSARRPTAASASSAAQLVDRLAGLGMILDLAHASERTFFEVLERAPDAPVVVSHACCRAVYDTPRNLSDDQLRALRDHDGVLAVMAHPAGGRSRRRRLWSAWSITSTTPSRSWAIEHVGIGADFMAQIVASGAEPACPGDEPHARRHVVRRRRARARGPADYPALVRGAGGTRLRRRRARGDPRRQSAASHRAGTRPSSMPRTDGARDRRGRVAGRTA